MRLEQNSGVEKLTTVGLPDASARSREMACRSHGGSRVQILARPALPVATGVAAAIALLPTAPGTSAATGTAPLATPRWPPPASMVVATSQFPAVGKSISAA